MKLAIVTATMGQPKGQECMQSWWDTARQVPETVVIDNSKHNRGVLPSMQEGYERIVTHYAEPADVIAFFHDDLLIKEAGWDERVLYEFEDPSVGVVGFGGALRHGDPDIYKTPYRLQQLGRAGYLSNVDDAEVHGERFGGTCDVAVLDGFCLIVRRNLLDGLCGWPVSRYPPHHNYDYWLCLSARRLGARTRVVGVRCHHLGGLTATSHAYNEWASATQWGSDVAMHEAGHRLIYEEFRDILPVVVKRP